MSVYGPHQRELQDRFDARRLADRLAERNLWDTIDEVDPLLAEYERAQCGVRVVATHVFPNCPRYIHKLELVERSRFVPKAGSEPPVPGWKRRMLARDVLPAGDPARD